MGRWWKPKRRGARELANASVYYPIRAALYALSLLPEGLRLPMARVLGGATRRFDRRHVRRARENLLAAFPEKTRAEIDRIIRGVYRHFGACFSDTLALRRCARRGELASFCRLPAHATIESLRAEGRGMIMATGHLGNWEVAGAVVGSVLPLAAVSRRYKNPHIKRAMERFRESFGQRIVYPEGGLHALVERLEAGDCVAILADKHLNSNRVPVEFFGRWVRAPSGPATLAMRTGAPLVVAGAVRMEGDVRYEVKVERVLRPDRTAPFKAELVRLTQGYLSGLERLIREHPEQWIWMHRRWKKTLAGGERDLRPHHGTWKAGSAGRARAEKTDERSGGATPEP